jgi:2-polyprenyl-3-methyl-5-hydroxy-6-metoxy-1,4-benzoquinol methylase
MSNIQSGENRNAVAPTIEQPSYFGHTRPEIMPLVPATISSAMDVGCARGYFGKALKEKFGCVVWGIEPNREAAENARASLDHVINDIFSDRLDLKGKKFDVIFFNDVLEHLVDPAEALRIARNHLSDNGCVIASIPNILHFETLFKIIKDRDWKYEEAGVMDKTHLRFFTRKSMIRLFEENGFRVDLIQGINPYFFRFIYYLNKFTRNRFDEFKYYQFAIRAYKNA